MSRILSAAFSFIRLTFIIATTAVYICGVVALYVWLRRADLLPHGDFVNIVFLALLFFGLGPFSLLFGQLFDRAAFTLSERRFKKTGRNP